jgi:hypothetical protein
MQYVIDQDDVPVFHIEWQVGRLYLRVQADAGEVVAVKGDVERSQWLIEPKQFV